MVKDEMDDFIDPKHFYHCFQPIYSLPSGNKKGIEALLRTKKGTTNTIFEQAKQTNRLYELDTQSIHKAIWNCYAADHAMKEGLLFLNIFPSTLLNPNFPSFMNKILIEHTLPCQHIVFELNETEQTFRSEDSSLLKERIIFLKKCGFLIAIDDIGKGWSSLSTLIDLEPSFAKLDRYFSMNLSTSPKKQMMISSLVQYCSNNQIELILEGIEKEEDLHVAKSLGIKLGQGYLLGKPELLKSNKFSICC
jgi:EAL domain-containing protein (putative c-di-GMP-specific phosphodiesterase class I)